MVKKLLQRGLLLLLVFGVVWMLVLIWWHQTHRMPTGSDIALYLAGLPSAVVAAYVILRGTLGGIYTALAAPKMQTTTAPQPQSDAPPPPAPGGRFKARLLHAGVRSGLGNSTHQIAQALAASQRAAIDPHLHDLNGFPIYAARVAELDQARVNTLRVALHEFDPSITWRDENVRTLALLDGVLMEAFDAIGAHAATQPQLHPVRHRPRRMHAVILIPTRWDEPTRATVERWLNSQSIEHKTPHQAIYRVMANTAPQAAFAEVDSTIAALNKHDAPDPDNFHIIAAAQSDLDDELVAHYDQSGTLFTGARQHAAVLGEAAAALVLQPVQLALAASTPAQGAAESPTAAPTAAKIHLARASFGQLALPISGSGRAAPETLQRIGQNALAAAPLKAEQIQALYADAGSHATRAHELTQFSSQRFPALTPLLDCLPLDGGCGVTGAAGALLTIAMAAHHVAQTNTAAFAVTLADPSERAALIALPGTQVFTET